MSIGTGWVRTDIGEWDEDKRLLKRFNSSWRGECHERGDLGEQDEDSFVKASLWVEGMDNSTQSVIET